MSEDDKVFNIIKGLNSSGQCELVKAQPNSLIDSNSGGKSSLENTKSLKVQRKAKLSTGTEGKKKDKVRWQ